MSNATKCDRCGAVYKGIETLIILPGQDDGHDLCADCARALDAWMECQPVTDATERVTESVEMLQREIATLKEHRAGNMDKLRELTDECGELRKWKGLAEKYRADSIAAQAECERYRAKLGAVLDAIHDAMRAAR